MKELRFHRELYPGSLVDEAIKVYDSWATIERAESATHWVVKISSRSAAAERKIAGELANYALGLTVRSGSPTDAVAAT